LTERWLRQGKQLDLATWAFASPTWRDRPAIDYYEQALVIAREIGARRTEAINLANLGDVLLDRDKFDEAVVHYTSRLISPMK